MNTALPPTNPELLSDDTLPYFLWWTDVRVGELKRLVRDPDTRQRAYWVVEELWAGRLLS